MTTLERPMFEPLDRDWEGLRELQREIEKNPDKTAKIDCFNRAEADWIREQLEARGLAGRFWTTWLTFRDPSGTP